MDLHPSFLCSFCLLPVLQQIDGDQRDCTCSEWGWKWSGAGGTTRGWEGKKQGWPQCQGSSLLWASFYGVSQVELIWLPLVIPSGVFSLIDHLNSLSWTSNDFLMFLSTTYWSCFHGSVTHVFAVTLLSSWSGALWDIGYSYCYPSYLSKVMPG